MGKQELAHSDGCCIYCGTPVEQYDATAGGADSNYGSGAAAEFDYPVTVECDGCGAKYCDGDLVEQPTDGFYYRSAEARAESEEALEMIVSGLIHRGVPQGLAHRAVNLVYSMGAKDILLEELQ